MSGYSEDSMTACKRYDAVVFDRLKRIHHQEKDKGTVRLYSNVNRLMYEAVEELEKGQEFSNLLQALQSEETAKGFHKKSHRSFWENALTNALRRSGYYLERARTEDNSGDNLLTKIIGQFDRREKVVTFLAPMEYVYLEIKEIRCQSFTIKRFTEAELNQFFERTLCETFFPWAVFDTATLSDYWFIVMSEIRPINPLGRINVNFGDVGKVRTRHSPFPAIEWALQALALVDWQPDKNSLEEWTGWLGFKIPFILQHSDHLLDRPLPAPNLSLLDREPNFNSCTGEEEGEKPACFISFHGEDSREFVASVKRLDQLLLATKPAMETWHFVRRAFDFLVKGYFSSGLEQLLWHMTVLEALFGEDQPGIVKRLRRRIGIVLSNSESKRKELGKQFDELYEFRSRLVHGDEFQKQIWTGHLREARDMARRCLLWFLNLAQVAISAGSANHLVDFPKRQEIMALIDLDPDATSRMAKVIASAPPGFPSIGEWTEN